MFRTGGMYAYNTYPGSGQIWLDDVVCSGSESRIDQCNHLPFGTHNCGHNEDQAIHCNSSYSYAFKYKCIGFYNNKAIMVLEKWLG